jgi:transcriptional regulator with XRE-family HTH domain
MAEATGLHWTYIGQAERGERNLTLRSIQKIAKGLKIEMVELFKGLG